MTFCPTGDFYGRIGAVIQEKGDKVGHCYRLFIQIHLKTTERGIVEVTDRWFTISHDNVTSVHPVVETEEDLKNKSECILISPDKFQQANSWILGQKTEIHDFCSIDKVKEILINHYSNTKPKVFYFSHE
jgi:hypothetical protein